MIRRSASTSMPASTMTRRPPASSISIRRSVECAVALSEEAATDATGPPSAITALTNPASDLVRFAAKALRQVTSRERDKPYRRAVAATRRGSDRLSKTIRAFSSSDQRRRRPVSTTSSRFSALYVWLSIRTVLNHQASPPQGGSPRRLTLIQQLQNPLVGGLRIDRLLAGPRLVLQPFKAVIGIAVPPKANNPRLNADFFGDRAGAAPVRRQQNYPRPLQIALQRHR